MIWQYDDFRTARRTSASSDGGGGGELKLGQLLNANPPFMMKQASDGVSLEAVAMFEQISFLAGIRINISGEGKAYDVVTDANGVYELYAAKTALAKRN